MTTASPPPPSSSPANKSTDEASAAAAEPPPPLKAMLDPQPDCVLCCYPLPLQPNKSLYYSCCGEMICKGCIIGQQRVLIIGENVVKPIKGSKEEEREFMRMFDKQCFVCPFCRAVKSGSQKECLKILNKRIDKSKDPTAMNMMAEYYMLGERGVTKNLQKAEELYKRSYSLGHPKAVGDLVFLYSNHIRNPVLAKQYLDEGVKRGNTYCMFLMANHIVQSGNYEEASRVSMTAARLGEDSAMKQVMLLYRLPGSNISKDDLSATIRAHKAVNDEGMNENREYAMRYDSFLEQLPGILDDFEAKLVLMGKLPRK